MNEHFRYLIEDDGAEFFSEYGMEKTGSTVGELVGRATNGGMARAAKVPRAAEVLAPRFRRIEKMAEPAQLEAELGLLKIAGSRRGRFGMTKAAADLIAELESDPVASEGAKDAAFNVIFATALQHDIEQLKLAMPAHRANAIGAAMIRKVAGILSSLGKSTARFFGHDVAELAERGVARGAAKAVGHEGAELAEKGIARGAAKAVGHEGAEAAEKGIGKAVGRGAGAEAAASGIPSKMVEPETSGPILKSSPRASATHSSVETGNNMADAEDLKSTQRIDQGSMPSTRKSGPVSAPNSVAKDRISSIEGSAKQNTQAATEAATPKAESVPEAAPPATAEPAAASESATGAEPPKKGYMNSFNKFMRGEKLEPEERAHVFKMGLGAVAADRLLTHANEGNK